MGSYLSKPKTQIDSTCGENDKFIYCTAEMQGWRKTQEDAHVAMLDFDDKNTVLFAVFDGHGGDEISKYCSLHFPEFIKNSKLYQENKIIESLEDSFLKFDNTLKEPSVLAELKKLANLPNDDDDDEDYVDESETNDLRKEASMPIEEILKKNFQSYVQNDGDDTNDVSDTEKKSIENGNAVKDDENKNESQDKEDLQEPSSTSAKAASNNSAKDRTFLFKSETLKAFLQDYLDEEDDEEDEEDGKSDDEDESEDENGECPDSDEDDNDDDDEDDDDDDDRENIANNLKNVLSMEYEPGKGSGCTAIVSLIRDNKLYVANVGDSRCVLSREGKAIDMSEDHKPEDDKERQRIVNAGGEITHDGRVNGGLNLSRAIGDHMYKNNTNIPDRDQMITALPDIRTETIDLDKDEFLFLACDGIWNSMSSQEVVDFINERLNNNVELKVICEELFKACLAPSTDGDGSGCDNMTCILVRFKKTNDENNKNDCIKNENNSCKRPLETNGESSEINDDHSDANNKNKRPKNNIDDEEENLLKPGSSKD